MNAKQMSWPMVVASLAVLVAVAPTPALAGRPGGAVHTSVPVAPHPYTMVHPSAAGVHPAVVQQQMQMQAARQYQMAQQMRAAELQRFHQMWQQMASSQQMQAARSAVVDHHAQFMALQGELQAKINQLAHKTAALRAQAMSKQKAELQSVRTKLQAQSRVLQSKIDEQLARMNPEQRAFFVEWMNQRWASDPMMNYYSDPSWAASFSYGGY